MSIDGRLVVIYAKRIFDLFLDILLKVAQRSREFLVHLFEQMNQKNDGSSGALFCCQTHIGANGFAEVIDHHTAIRGFDVPECPAIAGRQPLSQGSDFMN